MNNKPRAVSLLLCLVLTAAMGYMAVRVHDYGYIGMLLAVPKDPDAGGLTYEQAEALNGNKFVLTYERASAGQAATDYAAYAVTVLSVNYTYPYLLHYPVAYGGFFTEDAQGRGAKHAVLNEKAAFDMFGGIQTAGYTITAAQEEYTVVGVILDGDTENRNIYIPAAESMDMPNAYIFGTEDASGITDTYVMTECRTYGLNELRYDFINAAYIADSVREKAVAAAALLSCAMLCFICVGLTRHALTSAGKIRGLLKEHYAGALFIRRPADIAAFVGLCALTAASASAFLFLSRIIVAAAIKWTDHLSIIQRFATDCFAVKLNFLAFYATYSNAAFGLFVASLAFFIVSSVSSAG